MPFWQKYYGFARQVSVRQCSEYRILPTEALELLLVVTKGYYKKQKEALGPDALISGTQVNEIVDCYILDLMDHDDGWDD